MTGGKAIRARKNVLAAERAGKCATDAKRGKNMQWLKNAGNSLLVKNAKKKQEDG